MIPTILSGFFIYGTARVSDVSWGNSPDSGAPTIISKQTAVLINILFISINWGLSSAVIIYKIHWQVVQSILIWVSGMSFLLVFFCAWVLIKDRVCNPFKKFSGSGKSQDGFEVMSVSQKRKPTL